MENWEYSFDPVSKTDWIAQIERDLKGKSIESLEKEWWPGEKAIPIHHLEDVVSPAIILSQKLFETPPRIVELIDASTLTCLELNKQILEALQFGAQVFEITGKPKDEMDVDLILKDVIPKIIDWHLDDLQMLKAFTNKEPNNTFFQKQSPDNNPVSLSELKNNINEIQPARLLLQYSYLSEGDFTSTASKIFLQIVQALQDYTKSGEHDLQWFFDCAELKLTAGKDYFKIIIQMRVLHLLWQNLALHFTGKATKRHDYMTLYIPQSEEESADHFLIRASMCATAGCLCGAGNMCIDKKDLSNEPAFYKRISRNIHHLLHLESGLPKGQDPLAGAYTIDYYTRLWSERIWNNLSLE